MRTEKYLEQSLEKYGDIDNQVWYRPYYDSNPKFRNESGKVDYQSLLKGKIGGRVKLVRDSFKHRTRGKNDKEVLKKVPQDTFFPGNADRISAIENEKLPKKYKSVINGTIISNIIQMVNNKQEYKRIETSDLPYTIDGVWLVFGNDYDMHEFLKGVFYSLYEDLFAMYTCKSAGKNSGNIELSADTEIIQQLLYFNAPFSLMHGLLKILIKEEQDYITNPDVFNNKMRKILVDTIEYAWNLIAGDVLKLFEDTFEEIKELRGECQNYNSGNINSDIRKWNRRTLIPFLKETIDEIGKKDRIANIGLLVGDLMEELLHKREDDKNYNPDISYEKNAKSVLDKSDEIFIKHAMELTDLQYNDTIRRNKLRYMPSISEEIARAKDFELEGTYYVAGTNEEISFGN